MVHGYNGILFSRKRNEEKLIYIRTWMNLENIIQSEKSDTKGYIVYDSDYMKYPELANP